MNTGAPTVNRGKIVSMYAGLKEYNDFRSGSKIQAFIRWILGLLEGRGKWEG